MNIAKKRFLHQVQRRRENKNLKGRRPGLLIYFVLILGEKISSFNEIPWIVQEGKPDQSLALRPDPLAEQCLALCHLRVGGTVVGHATAAPSGPWHRHLGTALTSPCSSVPRQCCSVQLRGRGAPSRSLSARSSHASSSGTGMLGRSGLHS